MDKLIVYENSDGSLVIVSPVASLEEVLARDVPTTAQNVRIVDRNKLPADRTFRSAWIAVGSSVAVDMPKARVIQMNNLRKVREEKFKELDRDWIKYMGQKNQRMADEIEDKRQKLRDIPQTVNLEAATTPEELKAIWPDELK